MSDQSVNDHGVIEVGGFDAWDAAGKRFIEDELATQYVGLSVNSTQPGGETPFWHTHSRTEELYIILDGTGEFALGDEVIPLGAGTVVRAGQGVWRALRCLPDSATPLRWLCVRSGGDQLDDIGNDADLDRDRPFPWSA